MPKLLGNHWMVAKGVLRYLQGNIDFRIEYTDLFDVNLIGFSNSECAQNLDDRRSITGYAFNIGSGVLTCMERRMKVQANKIDVVSCPTTKKVLHSSIISWNDILKCFLTSSRLAAIIKPRRSLLHEFSTFLAIA